MCVCLVAQSCPPLCNAVDFNLPGFSVNGNSPGQNTGVGCHSLLQEIVPTQGLNPGFPHCRQILYHLSHQENLIIGYATYFKRTLKKKKYHMLNEFCHDKKHLHFKNMEIFLSCNLENIEINLPYIEMKNPLQIKKNK